MKILGLSNAYNTYKPQKANEVKKTGNAGTKKDALSISDTAKDYQTAARAVAKSPDMRQEKINAVKEKIQSGSYVISDFEIAEKILVM